LPEQIAASLLGSARDAFALAMQSTAAISGVVAITVAIVAGLLLRPRPSGVSNDYVC
jgi:hypothetical protein